MKKSKFQVVLINKNNYHQFPPLLYQVASSGLEYNEISFPYRKIFQKRKNFYFRLAEVYGVNPKGHPQVAQVAIQQGELLAENLQRIEAHKKPRPFHYKNLGTLATVGRNKAVADLNKVKLHGFTAWLVWMLVHLRSILGIKNKLIVLIDWIWNYFTYDRSMRFILFIQKHKQDGTQGTEPTL